MVRLVLYSLLLCSMLLSGCDKDLSVDVEWDTSADGSLVPGVTHSIAGLKNLHRGSSHRIPTDVVIEGVITANNIMGEYPYALIVEDDSGAIELTIFSSSSWHNEDYAIGNLVRVNCIGLWIGSLGGNVTIGTEPEPNGVLAVGYIYDEELASRVNVMEVGVWRDAQVVTVSDFREYIKGCYICLKDVEFQSGAGVERFCSRDDDSGLAKSTTHIMRDCNGDYFELYVPSTASYADAILPSGRGDMWCTLDSYYNSYSVRMVCFDHSFQY